MNKNAGSKSFQISFEVTFFLNFIKPLLFNFVHIKILISQRRKSNFLYNATKSKCKENKVSINFCAQINFVKFIVGLDHIIQTTRKRV